jgi:ubiquinone/menaquinone biosynthesis C-methylase UbiE
MKDEIRSHWNGRAKEYDKNARQVLYSNREKIAWQRIFSQALGKRYLKVLDVGTGPGVVANMLADLGHDVTGVDVSDGMLKKAKINSQELCHSLEFVQGDGENLPFGSETFDAVVNRYVLWNLPNPKNALAEWKRVLKPGGHLVIIDGTWYRRSKGKPLTKKVWQNLSFLLVMLTERRVPHYQDMNDDIWNQLWSSNLKRPEADVSLLESLGFRQIQIMKYLNKKLLMNMDFLKNGHGGDRFLISGIK